MPNFASAAKNAAGKIFDQISGKNARHLTPQAVLTINGRPFGTKTQSRIISISLTDKRGFEADELNIELDDEGGAIAIPEIGNEITLQLGYAETGLIDKGKFKVSEFTASGSPDRLNITARAADLAETLAEQVEKSWHKKTLFEIIETIAKKHGYPYKIADRYKQEKIAHIDQTNESDASFMSRLAEQYDAIATVKNGTLLFIPTGGGETAGGKPIPPAVITRAAGDSHSFSYSTSDSYSAVRAYYTDRRTGNKKEVVVNQDNAYPERKTVKKRKNAKGKTFQANKKENVNRRIDASGQKIKTLRHLYATENSAWSGARSAYKKLKRGTAQFSITLAAGRPDLFPETPATVSGFKPEIDAEQWLVTEAAHKLDGGGYTTVITLEARFEESGQG